MTDWSQIERDYRAGESVAQIARGHRVSHNTVYREAKRLGWKREVREPMSEERRQAILAKLGGPDDVLAKLGEFAKGVVGRG